MSENDESFSLVIDPISLPMNVTRGNNDRVTVTITDNEGNLATSMMMVLMNSGSCIVCTLCTL